MTKRNMCSHSKYLIYILVKTEKRLFFYHFNLCIYKTNVVPFPRLPQADKVRKEKETQRKALKKERKTLRTKTKVRSIYFYPIISVKISNFCFSNCGQILTPFWVVLMYISITLLWRIVNFHILTVVMAVYFIIIHFNYQTGTDMPVKSLVHIFIIIYSKF